MLLPVVALGRAQELLLILEEYWSRHPELHGVPIYQVGKQSACSKLWSISGFGACVMLAPSTAARELPGCPSARWPGLLFEAPAGIVLSAQLPQHPRFHAPPCDLCMLCMLCVLCVLQASGLARRALSVFKAYIEMMNDDIRTAFQVRSWERLLCFLALLFACLIES